MSNDRSRFYEASIPQGWGVGPWDVDWWDTTWTDKANQSGDIRGRRR